MRAQTFLKILPLAGLAAFAGGHVLSAAAGDRLAATEAAPDIVISEMQFTPGSNKGLRVKVRNQGAAFAGTSMLRLTLREIDGQAAGRSKDMMVTGLDAGAERWVAIDTTGLIPDAVALAETSFKLDADASGQVGEADETNNRVWHRQ